MKCEVTGGWSCRQRNEAVVLCRLWPHGTLVRVCGQCGSFIVLYNRIMEAVAQQEEAEPELVWTMDVAG